MSGSTGKPSERDRSPSRRGGDSWKDQTIAIPLGLLFTIAAGFIGGGIGWIPSITSNNDSDVAKIERQMERLQSDHDSLEREVRSLRSENAVLQRLVLETYAIVDRKPKE